MSEDAPAITHHDLVLSRARWARITIDTYSFGMYTVMVAMTFYFLFKRGNVWTNNRVAFCYTSFMAVVTTAWYYTTARVTEVVAIEYLAPQFSSQIGLADSCAVTNMLGSTLSLLMMITSDVLVLYRAWIIVDLSIFVMAIPTAMIVVFTVLGTLLNASCSVNVHIPEDTLDKMAIAFYSISPAFNMLVTGMISYTLIRQHMRIRKAVAGPLNGVYISIVGIVAESAVIYSITTLTFAILIARKDPNQRWWEGPMTSASFLCQAWIILRIAMGTAYTRSGTTTNSSSKNIGHLVFNSRGRSTLVATNPSQSVDKFEEGAYDMDRMSDRKTNVV